MSVLEISLVKTGLLNEKSRLQKCFLHPYYVCGSQQGLKMYPSPAHCASKRWRKGQTFIREKSTLLIHRAELAIKQLRICPALPNPTYQSEHFSVMGDWNCEWALFFCDPSVSCILRSCCLARFRSFQTGKGQRDLSEDFQSTKQWPEEPFFLHGVFSRISLLMITSCASGRQQNPGFRFSQKAEE